MTWPEPPNYFNPPQHGYKVVLQQPQHPVVHADPSFMQVASNMRPGSWALVGGMMLFGAAAGYYTGAKSHWQRPAMYFGMGVLGKTGMAWGLTDSAYRLMGYKENSIEVAQNIPGQMKPEAYA
mmetsp:Transcript_4401/g.11970  ORF Transcript_4401/g.11970 Transcript_4401/m.11970 type:complete len:123 (-) Transcript_4401:593-961(-)|eukprot:CAMPEP_0202371016 /NCGR_PEP_ID=MMETSP1127-20130417/2504_1 /ASSEMBLY_ACC=CAM_ASM_000462 /TAXON_ID=3047 /ORGANISM="Dunaliella tertiolecta, Strain CCMP1320" /LENGTH=122 /DNA_ID=CAMNT_0048967113 /DNA_START=116 /DNA_END=484 /DNA_ORIENTATION=-